MLQVDCDAGVLHLGQRLLHRQLHFTQQCRGVDAGQLLVERFGQVHHRHGPQDSCLHRLLVDARSSVVEQRKLLLLWVFRAKLAAQIAQREVVEGEAALPGAHQVGRQRGVGGDAGQRPAASPQVVHRQLCLVQRLGLVGIGQPRRQRRFVFGVQRGRVDVAALAVGGDDGQRGGVSVVRPGGCPPPPARTASPSLCSASHARQSPGSSAPPRTSNPSSTSGSTAASVSNNRSRSTRNSRSSNSRWIWSRSHGCRRSVSGVCASATSLTSSVRSLFR